MTELWIVLAIIVVDRERMSAKALEDAINNDRHLPSFVLVIHNVPLRVNKVTDEQCRRSASRVTWPNSWITDMASAQLPGRFLMLELSQVSYDLQNTILCGSSQSLCTVGLLSFTHNSPTSLACVVQVCSTFKADHARSAVSLG